MAKIKVQLDPDVDTPDEQGYVNVVDNLFTGDKDLYDDFVDAEPDERPQFLRNAAGAGHFVTHLVLKADGTDKAVEITNATCRIVGEKDKRKKPHASKSRFTIPFPDKQPGNLDYLAPYAVIIHRLYAEAKVKDQEADVKHAAGDFAGEAVLRAEAIELRSRAHRFMFGVMMLTRCR